MLCSIVVLGGLTRNQDPKQNWVLSNNICWPISWLQRDIPSARLLFFSTPVSSDAPHWENILEQGGQLVQILDFFREDTTVGHIHACREVIFD